MDVGHVYSRFLLVNWKNKIAAALWPHLSQKS